jgi:hypothetical protein
MDFNRWHQFTILSKGDTGELCSGVMILLSQGRGRVCTKELARNN